jgi:U5 snRNP spliceosome subunit
VQAIVAPPPPPPPPRAPPPPLIVDTSQAPFAIANYTNGINLQCGMMGADYIEASRAQCQQYADDRNLTMKVLLSVERAEDGSGCYEIPTSTGGRQLVYGQGVNGDTFGCPAFHKNEYVYFSQHGDSNCSTPGASNGVCLPDDSCCQDTYVFNYERAT